jgi:protein-tyrosine phosphatase
LDAVGTAEIAGLGLRSIVDLRTQPEVDNAPSALDGLQARVRHISLLTGDLQSIPLTLTEIYRYFIDECGAAIAAAVADLCTDDALPALVHCSAGKDRTGVVIALILAVLGVPDEVIAADYALSGGYLDPDRTTVIGQLQASTGLGEELTSALLSSPPALILDALARVRAAAGSETAYLRAHGLPETAIARLRSALIV